VLAACCFFGVAVASLASRIPRGALLAGLCCAAIVGPNLADYPRISELEAPDQVSSVSDTVGAVQVLERLGLHAGYSDYLTAYPITYLSGERVIVAPPLP